MRSQVLAGNVRQYRTPAGMPDAPDAPYGTPAVTDRGIATGERVPAARAGVYAFFAAADVFRGACYAIHSETGAAASSSGCVITSTRLGPGSARAFASAASKASGSSTRQDLTPYAAATAAWSVREKSTE